MMHRGLSLVMLLSLAALLPAVSHGQSDDEGYRVKPGDVLQVSVGGEPELQAPVLIAPDGSFSFPLVGHIDARGKTTVELQEILNMRLQSFIATPLATVSIAEVNGNKIYVLGQVNGPGEFIMNPAVDVMQALSMAGGTTPFANLDNIQILRRNGREQVALGFRYSDVIRGRNLAQNIQLQSGDVVVVP